MQGDVESNRVPGYNSPTAFVMWTLISLSLILAVSETSFLSLAQYVFKEKEREKMISVFIEIRSLACIGKNCALKTVRVHKATVVMA